MKVAQICRSLQRVAGTERFVLETSREMIRRGIETRVYTTDAIPRLLADSSFNIEVENRPILNPPMFDLYTSLAVSKMLIDKASSWADIVILHTGTSVANYAWKKHNLPCVPFFHYDQYDASLFGVLQHVAPLYTYPLGVLESKCIRTVPMAFANSHSLSDKMRERVKGGKLVIIPLGVDVSRFFPTWNDEGFILMVGRFHPANNFELGILAAARTPYKIVVAGIRQNRFLWYYHYLQDIVAHIPELNDRVEFLTPNDDELIRLIQNCSVFLSPRKYDYLGLAALEAMACGKPVIAYRTEEKVEGLLPIIENGTRIQDWQSTLATLMADINLRERLGKQSHHFIERGHTITNTVDLMMDSIKEFL